MGTAYKSCSQRRHRGQDKAEIITPLSPGTVEKRSECMGGSGAESTRSIHCSIERAQCERNSIHIFQIGKPMC